MELPVKIEDVSNKIIHIQNCDAIIDSDVAKLYGVSTKSINQAVKNNPEKFPLGYVLELTQDEKAEVVKNFDHLKGLKFSSQLPKAFPEKGLYMLATILKSEKATSTTIAIIETFTKFKTLSRNIKELSSITDNKQKQSLMQKSGELIAEILDDDLAANERETTIELNFVVLKFKHTVKRKKDK
jgi:hypothetical protein